MIKLKFPSSIKLGLGLIFVALLSPKMALGAPNSQAPRATTVISPCLEALTIDALPTRLKENIYGDITQQQTVSYLGHNNKDQVVLVKSDKKSIWTSRYATYNGSPQGDPRWFFYFAGTELARNFGFDLRETEKEILVLAPNAKRLKETVDRLNTQLLKNNEEPIFGLPTKAGYVNSQQMLDLSINTSEPLILYFPYEDDSAELTAHEIAFHLFLMLFSKKILAKTKEINLENLLLASDLRQSGLPKADIIVSQLLDHRSMNYDGGTALLGTFLAKVRASWQLDSYNGMLKGNKLPISLLQEAVIALADPIHSAQQNVIGEQLKIILTTTNLLDTHEKQAYLKWREDRMKSERYLNSIPKVRQDPEAWTIEYISSLDARIDVLNKAFEAIKKQTKN